MRVAPAARPPQGPRPRGRASSVVVCAACAGRGWLAQTDELLPPGEHAEYLDGLTEYWWAPCECCNPGARRVPEPPPEEE